VFRGYLVAAIDQPYVAAAVAFPTAVAHLIIKALLVSVLRPPPDGTPERLLDGLYRNTPRCLSKRTDQRTSGCSITFAATF
jgi:hypothetical protein